MKAIAVLGSPRANGISAKVARRILDGAADSGHEVLVYEIDKMKVHGCRGCGYCKTHDADCCIRDDLEGYWENLHEAGALVVSAPNYFSQVCGPMLTFMNRHYCLTRKDHTSRLHDGMKLVGVFSQGMPKPYEAAEKNYRWYLECLSARSMQAAEPLICSAGMAPDEMQALLDKAYETGKNL